ncbi:hypothetical protein SEA_FUSHIGI_62 [Mycobacterium phage Fushigi]|nr:hypothetical protein SEA_FUSHIGI_62 [Mycobacterium phage Fushigi]
MTNINTRELVSLLYEQRVRGASSAAIAEKLVEKYDITEKPEPRDPIGTVRATRVGRPWSVYVKTDEETWLALYSSGVRTELSDNDGPWGNVEVFRP